MSTALAFPFPPLPSWNFDSIGTASLEDPFAPRPARPSSSTTNPTANTITVAPTTSSYSPWGAILEGWNGSSNPTVPVDPFVSRYGISRDDLKKQYIASQLSGYHLSDPNYQVYLPNLITDLSKKEHYSDTELDDNCKNVLKMQPRDFLGVGQSQVPAPAPSFFSATTSTLGGAGSGTNMFPTNSTAKTSQLEDFWMNVVGFDASVPASEKHATALHRMNTEPVSQSALDTFRAQYASLMDPPSTAPSQPSQSLPDYLNPANSMETIVNTNDNTGRSVSEVLGRPRGSVSHARHRLREFGPDSAPESDWRTVRFA
jgi:hypothetical protein